MPEVNNDEAMHEALQDAMADNDKVDRLFGAAARRFLYTQERIKALDPRRNGQFQSPWRINS